MTNTIANLHRDVVIMGAGQAGLSCAKALRMYGFSGSIMMIGAESYRPYDRPPLSKAILSGEASPEAAYYMTADDLRDQRIEIQTDETIVEINRSDKTVRTAINQIIGYGNLVVTTGSRVRNLSLPGAQEANIHYLRDMDDCLSLSKAITPGKKVLVLGGGLIGLEVAAAARKLGARPTVVEVADRVMARVVGPEVSGYFQDLHRKNGVEILMKKRSAKIRSTSHACFVDFDNGTYIEGDIIVAGIGVMPNDTVAAEAGLKTDNGLWVDEFCRTNDANIWAAGDVTNHFNPHFGHRLRLETWQNAKSQGVCVARNLCGHKVPYSELPWGWSDQFGANLQMLGIPDSFDGGVARGNVSDGSFSTFYLKDGLIAGMVAVNAVRDVAVSRRLMADKIPVDVARLRDTSVPMKSLLST